MRPSEHAVSQYSQTTGKLTARMAIHAYGTNPQSWFSWLSTRVPSSGDVLEVGAGTGELWRWVDPSRARLTLVDFSPAMCARLREVPGARIGRCDAAALPFEDESFDGVIANHMLYHVDDPAAAVREFARVLRPGGRLAVALNGRDHFAEVRELGPAIGQPGLTLTGTRENVTVESAPALIAAHFTEVAVEDFPGDLVVPAAEPVLAYLLSMPVDPVTPGQQAAARAMIEARIAAHGSFRISKRTGLVTARRP